MMELNDDEIRKMAEETAQGLFEAFKEANKRTEEFVKQMDEMFNSLKEQVREGLCGDVIKNIMKWGATTYHLDHASFFLTRRFWAWRERKVKIALDKAIERLNKFDEEFKNEKISEETNKAEKDD